MGGLQVAIQLSEAWRPAALNALPADVFAGGWVGYTSYDTVRYVYPSTPHPHPASFMPGQPPAFSRLCRPLCLHHPALSCNKTIGILQP